MMQNIIEQLSQTISEQFDKLGKLSPAEFGYKPNPEKWSNKEVIGHLIDSAHNNLRRFIVGQYSPDTKIVYEQDIWVKANNYQEMDPTELIQLWMMMNKRIIAVLSEMPPEKYNNTIDTEKTEFSPKTLIWLAEDYVRHMQHHMNQVFPHSYDVVYS